MNINRHNYEEFFLLYVDDELSAAERKTVDVFVKENPDLLIEMTMLQQTVVKADDIVLDKKDWLYMEEDITAMQENLLLYVDDELAPADKKSIEALLVADKIVQAEWNILKQTKLQPDSNIVFADKQSLYRREEGRIVGMKWWRVAAAAVLLGFGIWAGVSVYKYNVTNPAVDGGLVKNNGTTQTIQKTEVPVITETIRTQPEEKSAIEINAAVAVQKNMVEQKENSNDQQNKTAVKESIAVQNNDNKKPDNNLPKPYFENINNNASNKTIAATVIPENNSGKVSGNNTAIARTNPKESLTNSVVTNLNKDKTEQTTAVLVANNKTGDENTDNRYLNVDDDKEKRTGLGGFLRKAKRMIERTTNINTGEGIKVAGFEIALK